MGIQYHVADSSPRETRAKTPSWPLTNGFAKGDENATIMTSESCDVIASIGCLTHDPAVSTGTLAAAAICGAERPLYIMDCASACTDCGVISGCDIFSARSSVDIPSACMRLHIMSTAARGTAGGGTGGGGGGLWAHA